MKIEEAKELLDGPEDENGERSGSSEYLKDGVNFIDGLLLLKKYIPDLGKSHDISAQHDIIYLCDFIEEMTAEDIIQLNRWGFHINEEEESWAKFT